MACPYNEATAAADEIVGHYLAYAIYYDLAADEAEKSGIRSVVERITSHILDNGYHLIDVDGKPTRWGWWAPDEIWADPDETGLRALHLLSHLKVATHITGNPKFERVYSDLITLHNYALLTRNQKINIPSRVIHSDISRGTVCRDGTCIWRVMSFGYNLQPYTQDLQNAAP